MIIKLQKILFWLGLILILSLVNFSIYQKQQTLDTGKIFLMKLRPVDPRSLMQGDYMRLAYDEKLYPSKEILPIVPRKGIAIFSLDSNNVAKFVRLDDDSKLKNNEHKLEFHSTFYNQEKDNRDIMFGADSFFFQEGDAKIYEKAVYGMLRVDEYGKSVLFGLADKGYKRLMPNQN